MPLRSNMAALFFLRADSVAGLNIGLNHRQLEKLDTVTSLHSSGKINLEEQARFCGRYGCRYKKFKHLFFCTTHFIVFTSIPKEGQRLRCKINEKHSCHYRCQQEIVTREGIICSLTGRFLRSDLRTDWEIECQLRDTHLSRKGSPTSESTGHDQENLSGETNKSSHPKNHFPLKRSRNRSLDEIGSALDSMKRAKLHPSNSNCNGSSLSRSDRESSSEGSSCSSSKTRSCVFASSPLPFETSSSVSSDSIDAYDIPPFKRITLQNIPIDQSSAKEHFETGEISLAARHSHAARALEVMRLLLKGGIWLDQLDRKREKFRKQLDTVLKSQLKRARSNGEPLFLTDIVRQTSKTSKTPTLTHPLLFERRRKHTETQMIMTAHVEDIAKELCRFAVDTWYILRPFMKTRKRLTTNYSFDFHCIAVAQIRREGCKFGGKTVVASIEGLNRMMPELTELNLWYSRLLASRKGNNRVSSKKVATALINEHITTLEKTMNDVCFSYLFTNRFFL